MPSIPVPVVHIGYHKTATTWMQKLVFPLLSDRVALFGRGDSAVRVLMNSPTLAFDARRCRRDVAMLLLGQGGRICVFSAERLSGNPHSGGYDAAMLADRIKGAFGDARILMVVREQVSMLVATYKQYVRGGGICTLEEYLRPPRDRRIPLFRLNNFRYHALVEYYVRLFGDRHVLVLPYELLVRDRDGFLRRVLDYIGLDDFTLPAQGLHRRLNLSPTDLQVRLMRWVNLLAGGSSLHPVRPRAPRLTKRLFRLVRSVGATDAARHLEGRFRERAALVAGDRYARSNSILQRYVAADLRSLGYRL